MPEQSTLETSKALFLKRKKTLHRVAQMRFTAALVLGVDIDEIARMSEPARAGLLRRTRRMIERERLRGVAGHRSYDFNRHLALKNLRDNLVAGGSDVDIVGCSR